MNIKFKLPRYLVEVIGKDLDGIKESTDEVRLPPQSKHQINKLKEHITSRFKLFENEINNEERLSGDTPYILLDYTDDPLEIKYINYSEALETKMKDNFTAANLLLVEKLLVHPYNP